MMAPGPGAAEDTFPVEEDVSDADEFDIAGPEFRSINAAMDQLQLALDRLESRNAGIHEELLELLQSNREIRMAFNQEANSEGNNSDENYSEENKGDTGNHHEKYCNGEGGVSASSDNSKDSTVGTSNLAKNIQNNLTSGSALADLKLDDEPSGTD